MCIVSNVVVRIPLLSVHMLTYSLPHQGGNGGVKPGEGGYFPCSAFRNVLIKHPACTGIVFFAFYPALHSLPSAGKWNLMSDGFFWGGDMAPPKHYIFPVLPLGAVPRGAKSHVKAGYNFTALSCELAAAHWLQMPPGNAASDSSMSQACNPETRAPQTGLPDLNQTHTQQEHPSSPL